ncbi:acetylcholine receptor subunit alpha-like [Nematostella vectensis]|uniref:acetylcholine receptor subunit alpha-like n=1 Tax=Nematostella vectensis TaxID=45351 RepID=UPI001390685B|nr:acetylcholine receptor subunit alpha-like [Nematostella vectensis]XP_032221048.1 acetylcholine receptor subunit alpha-like [Nematostella vectensis]XP_032221049.1 acetylcholine receptor subunit alpha-like [Nematostella vectensis]XP_048575620.1 acetylcholine receptor subunit alpha-like [Nematostella vectensis]
MYRQLPGVWIIAWLVTVLAVSKGNAALSSIEKVLVDDLLSNYRKEARPVSNPNVTTNVTFGMELVQLVQVQDRHQMITTNVWVRQMWKNELLTWDPSKYKGITRVRLDASQVWIPDIVLYNSADNDFSGGTEKFKTPIIVDYTGQTSWFCPASFTSTCKIDVTYFPFDVQTCAMKFGSWTFEEIDLNMLPENSSMTSKYVESAEWELLKTTRKRNAEKYSCCKYPLTDVTFHINIKRKPLFYIFNLVVPCMIILSMILLGFFLPPESGERITLSITILLAMAVFLQLVGESLPRNSETIPLLGTFYIAIMAEISISLMLTCFVLNIHYRGTGNTAQEVPMWARIVMLQWLGYLLCVRRPDGSKPAIHSDKTLIRDTRKKGGYSVSLAYEYADMGFAPSGNCHCSRCTHARLQYGTQDRNHVHQDRNHVHSPEDGKYVENRYPGEASPIGSPGWKRRPTEPTLAEEISVLSNSIRQREKVEKHQEDWKYFAMVMDRLFFWLYCSTILISSFTIILQRPSGEPDN